ncbi:flavin reductase domain protein FMN-binding protein [Ancylobacter novellus DSM 506]|uniref:Flavin reductase domain protein FMN-binding protein n=1 Tax=Ancylobacter novellus (strain ATCC 8093 / DSM 506 / JCM 20403 / CCM 1077 / IAM 12100 / NBRC 12443 / NCIMB 10456) TaxID=639283 RepID=D7A1L7_ANCN5|nr:flavin reductase domain protein FMN-binding protein [Ancylobacter novellus DSM 506]
MSATDPRAAAKALAGEPLPAAVSRDLYRAGMSKLPAAVNIITSLGEEGRYGFTASAVCSVTDSPPTLLVCVNRSNQSHQAITSSRVLCVNTLAGPHHEALSMAFAGGMKTMDERFAAAGWTTLVTGAPVLAEATVAFDCRVTQIAAVGTHDVVFCEVLGLQEAGSSEGLVYFGRRFHHLT